MIKRYVIYLFIFWPRNILLRNRDTAIRDGSTQDRKLKPNSQRGPLGPGTLLPGVLTVSHQQTHKTASRGADSSSGVPQSERICDASWVTGPGGKTEQGPALPKTTHPLRASPRCRTEPLHILWPADVFPMLICLAEPQLPGGNSLCLLRTLPAWVHLVCGPSVDLHLPSGPCLYFN